MPSQLRGESTGLVNQASRVQIYQRANFIFLLVFSPQRNIIPEFPRNHILKHLKLIIKHYRTCLRSSGVRGLVL